MNLVQHYNDLTEINGLRYQPYVAPGQERPSLAKALAQCEAQIKTRIAFTDVKTSYPETIRLMDEAGWKIGRKTRDWHRVHGGDRELRLYYKIFPNNNSDLKDERKRVNGTYPDHHSLSGSCSMGLIDNIGRDWLKSPIYPERYLTLIRLDRKRTPEEIAKMRYYKYRIVFTSDVARYFANGWRPEDYFEDDIYGTKEKEFWASKDSPKIDGFKYEPAV